MRMGGFYLRWEGGEGVGRSPCNPRFLGTIVIMVSPHSPFSECLDKYGKLTRVSCSVVTTSSPLLPQMSGLVEWLNETREFYWFVKKVGPICDTKQTLADNKQTKKTGANGIRAVCTGRAACSADTVTWRR
jgi:hypothetical protein